MTGALKRRKIIRKKARDSRRGRKDPLVESLGLFWSYLGASERLRQSETDAMRLKLAVAVARGELLQYETWFRNGEITFAEFQTGMGVLQKKIDELTDRSDKLLEKTRENGKKRDEARERAAALFQGAS
ncbi:MAG: hypothetical protein IJM30_05055 [Thermoguttaceae bacterium]|nr:hypothetical protein [Thermoguttaceae bacterium]